MRYLQIRMGVNICAPVFGMAAKIGVLSWYDYLKLIMDKKSGTPIRWLDYAWLYIIYPFLLGVAYKLGEVLYTWITSLLK